MWMAGSLVSFSATAVAVRNLATTLGIFEILALRSVFGLVLIGLAALALPRLRGRLAMRRPGLHLLRNVPHWLGQAGWAYGVAVLPLATAFALEFTAPVWLTILAVLILGERLTAPRLAAVALGLAGVLVVLRPGLVPLEPASFAVLAAAFTFALTGVITKKLTATESTLAILFWMNVIQLPLNLAFSQPDLLSRIQPGQLWGVAGVGIAGLTSHLCLTQAYRHGDAIVVIPLDFLRIPLIAAVGWLVYGEPLDAFVFLGAGVIVAGIVWNMLAESRRAPGLSASRRPGSAPAS